MKKSFRQYVSEAMEVIVTLPAEDAMEHHANPNCLFVDVRDVRELERDGMIAGAFHAPRGMLEFWIDPESPYFKPIFGEKTRYVFYCASGWRSALAAKVAQEMGLPGVAHVEGGFRAWQDADGPVAPYHHAAERRKAVGQN